MAGGVTVAMGANTLSQPATMTITEYAASSAPITQGALQVSFMPNVYLIDAGGLEPQGGASVTIILPYDPASIPSGYTTADLSISYYDDTQWVTLPVTVDTVNHTVTVVTNHFSWWGLVIRVHTPIPGGGSSYTIYPNPVTGSQVKVYTPMQKGAGDLKIQILTIASRKVKDLTIPNVQPGTAVTVDLLDQSGVTLANGLYYVATTPAGGFRSIEKLLILR